MVLLFSLDYGCEQGTYKCKNYKCIPTSAHNCDGIDWCGDSSGCEPNWGLIGGLIGGIGSAFLGLCIGGCLVCRLKMVRRHGHVDGFPLYNLSTVIQS